MKRKVVLLWYIVLSALMALTMPITVIWDSYLYLTSGHSLFTSDFPAWYLLMREPGYPFLIWFTTKFLGLGLWALVFLQSVMIGLGIFLVSSVFSEKFRVTFRVEIVLGTLGLVLVRGYGATVIQQALIFLVLCVAFYMITNDKLYQQKNQYWKFIILGFVSASIAVQLAIIVVCALILRLAIEYKSLFLNWYVIPATIVGSLLILGPWYNFTSKVDLSKQIYPTCRNAFCLSGYSGEESNLDKSEQMISSASALLFISRETYATVGPNPRVAQEASTLGSPWFNTSQNRCVRLGPGPEKEVSKTKDLLDYHCSSVAFMKVQGLISMLTWPIFPLSGLFFIFWLGRWLLAPTQKTNFVLIIPLSVIAFYSIAGAGISRYNSILPALGPFLIYLWFSRKKTVNQTEPSSP